MYFLYNLHPLFHLKVLKLSFSNSRLFPNVDNPLLQETLFELEDLRSGANVAEHVEQHPSVSSHRCLSRSRGVRRRKGSGSCLAPLTECYARVWWCISSCSDSRITPHVTSIFFSLKAHQPYFLFFLHSFFFHPHNFNFLWSFVYFQGTWSLFRMSRMSNH